MKYAVTLYHVANVKQTIYVDAETEEEAENKVFEGEMWDDGNWQYVGVDMDSYPEVSNIESLEDKMELTQAQIDFRNKLEELADRAGSALVLPDNSQMDAEAFLKAIDKSEVETILNELGVEKKSEEYKDGVPYTGDEIHFTDGTIWSCLLLSSLRPISRKADCVVFIPMSFKNWLDGEFVSHPYFIDEVKSLLKDALKGGAKIVRGVGLAKDN